MINELKNVLALIGGFVVIAASLTLLLIIILKIYDSITIYRDNKKYEYVLAHRFDDPPLAKCYCIDCEYCYGKAGKSGDGVYCSLFKNGIVIRDNSFCYRAQPKRKEDILSDCETV